MSHSLGLSPHILPDPKTQAYNLKSIRLGTIPRCLREVKIDFQMSIPSNRPQRILGDSQQKAHSKKYKTKIQQAVDSKPSTTESSTVIINYQN